MSTILILASVLVISLAVAIAGRKRLHHQRSEEPASTEGPGIGSTSLSMPQLTTLASFLGEIGKANGSATQRQLSAVSRLGMGELPGLSSAQAGALLSARQYCEGILHAETGMMNGYPNERWIEAKAVEFIIRDPALRKRVIMWNKRSFSRGGAEVPRPKKDEHYEKIRTYVRELLRQ